MRTLLHIELIKIFLRPRSYIAFLAIAIIVVLIEAGIAWEGAEILDLFLSKLKEAFVLQGNLLNGYLITFLVLNTLWIHVPLLIALVCGDLVSGEAQAGTFRLILTRPVGRKRLLLAKYLAGQIYALMVVLLLALFSLGGGLLFFGQGDLLVFYKTVNIIPVEVLPGRFLGAFLYGALAMGVVASLAFFFSCLAQNSLGPILATVAVLIGFTIISTFEVGLFKSLAPFLFTTYLSKWQAFFAYEVDYATLIHSSLVLGVHALTFLGLGIWVFERKDITS